MKCFGASKDPVIRRSAPLLTSLLAFSTCVPQIQANEDLADVLKTFGAGVITHKSDSADVTAVEEFVSADLDDRVFLIVEGDGRGKGIDFNVEAQADDQSIHLIHMGKNQVSTILFNSSSLYRSQEVDDDTSSIARFTPAEPVLLSKQSTGTPVHSEIEVAVTSIAKPSEITHRGKLKCTYEVLGTFEVKSPVGVFETICIRTQYKGSVGPADIDDSRYVFFAKESGPIALRTASHIQAMIFYNKTKKQSLLLHSCDFKPATPPAPPVQPAQ